MSVLVVVVLRGMFQPFSLRDQIHDTDQDTWGNLKWTLGRANGWINELCYSSIGVIKPLGTPMFVECFVVFVGLLATISQSFAKCFIGFIGLLATISPDFRLSWERMTCSLPPVSHLDVGSSPSLTPVTSPYGASGRAKSPEVLCSARDEETCHRPSLLILEVSGGYRALTLP